jgi:hypothetical protein
MNRSAITARQRWASALLFVVLLLSGCDARGEDRDIRVMNGDTNQPEPGVMVLVWRTGRTTGFFGNYSGYCDNEFIAVTDANGMVKVPGDITGTPLRYALMGVKGYFGSLAYKRGMADAFQIDTAAERASRPREFTKEQREKEPTLLQILTIRKDTRSASSRAAYLLDMTSTGCSCNALAKVLFAEAREIYTPPPGVHLATLQRDERLCK